jgi:hypothetical protein
LEAEHTTAFSHPQTAGRMKRLRKMAKPEQMFCERFMRASPLTLFFAAR